MDRTHDSPARSDAKHTRSENSAYARMSESPDLVLRLQRIAGNQFVQRQLAPGVRANPGIRQAPVTAAIHGLVPAGRLQRDVTDPAMEKDLAALHLLAADIVAQFNGVGIADQDFTIDKLKQLLADFKVAQRTADQRIVNSLLDKPLMIERKKTVSSIYIGVAASMNERINKRGAALANAALKKLMSDDPITFALGPGAAVQRDPSVPSLYSNTHIGSPGIQALLAAGISLKTAHSMLNQMMDFVGATLQGKLLTLLDNCAAANLWTFVKPAGFFDFFDKLSKAKDEAGFKGAYAELWETYRIVTSGELQPGTKISLGSKKVRPKVPGMKVAALNDQDVDISFHSGGGERRYHEIKADPVTLIHKITRDKDPATAPVIQQTPGVNPPESNLPDQLLSYDSLRSDRQSKTTHKTPHTAIKVVWVTPSLERWLRIFTTEAAARLIRFNYDLRIADKHLVPAQLATIQARVNAATNGMDPAAKQNWADAESPGRTPAIFLA